MRKRSNSDAMGDVNPAREGTPECESFPFCCSTVINRLKSKTTAEQQARPRTEARRTTEDSHGFGKTRRRLFGVDGNASEEEDSCDEVWEFEEELYEGSNSGSSQAASRSDEDATKETILTVPDDVGEQDENRQGGQGETVFLVPIVGVLERAESAPDGVTGGFQEGDREQGVEGLALGGAWGGGSWGGGRPRSKSI